MKLKFGHRVIAWDGYRSRAKKGRYISYINDRLEYMHNVLLDGEQITTVFCHAELDPDATEFLTGDEVEMRGTNSIWFPRKYGHKGLTGGHYDHYNGKHWQYCRYPRKDPHHGKTAIIDGKEYELRLK